MWEEKNSSTHLLDAFDRFLLAILEILLLIPLACLLDWHYSNLQMGTKVHTSLSNMPPGTCREQASPKAGHADEPVFTQLSGVFYENAFYISRTWNKHTWFDDSVCIIAHLECLLRSIKPLVMTSWILSSVAFLQHPRQEDFFAVGHSDRSGLHVPSGPPINCYWPCRALKGRM